MPVYIGKVDLNAAWFICLVYLIIIDVIDFVERF